MNVAVKVTPSETRDSGKVRMGSLSPSFRPSAPTGPDRGQRQGPHGLDEPELPGRPRNTRADRRWRQGPHGLDEPGFPAVRTSAATRRWQGPHGS